MRAMLKKINNGDNFMIMIFKYLNFVVQIESNNVNSSTK
jgi:hypothetical protein